MPASVRLLLPVVTIRFPFEPLHRLESDSGAGVREDLVDPT